MFHGNKKKEDKKPLTEEEIQKIEVTLHKIKTIQKEILDRRDMNNFDEKNLDFLFKASSIMPDFYTLWNYRKSIILELGKNKTEQEFKNFIKNEINQISQIQKGNPKSYVIWHHRVWLLKLSSQIEKQNKTPLNESLLISEIKTVNFFLDKDDRNFHVWNHRLTIFNMIRENFEENFAEYITKELEFTLVMIKKNCSNFSAWHYRSKLIPIYFHLNKKEWNSQDALDYFKLDLELITNAVYTDPKDESAWNYHLWLINNLTPIYVKSLKIDVQTVEIKFSHIFKCLELIEIYDENNKVLNNSEFLYTSNKNEFSDSITVSVINSSIRSFRIVSKSEADHKVSYSKNNIELPEILINIDMDKNVSVKINYKNIFNHHKVFLDSQLKMIDNLISSSDCGFLEFAHHRKVQILSIHQYILDSKSELLSQEIHNQYEILRANSKRMINMYKNC